MKNLAIENKIRTHKEFLERVNVEKPIISSIYGWEGLSRYTENTSSIFPKGIVDPNDLTWDRFSSMYQSYAQKLPDNHELFFTLEPLTFFPWAEAAVGCAVEFSGSNFWSKKNDSILTHSDIDEWINKISKHNSNFLTWIEKYEEFIDHLSAHFSDKYPIGQSILRGPLDMAAALIGEENLIYKFLEVPKLIEKLLLELTEVYLSFLNIQQSKLPKFNDGNVIGSYYIWTPGSCLRHQEDAMAILSPDLYQQFVHPIDQRIAAKAEYTLFHLHSSGLHHLEILLSNFEINIFQISKDEGIKLKNIIDSLKKIQLADKSLLLKGRFDSEEMVNIKKELDPTGLCIQAIVNSKEEEDFIRSFY